MKIWQQHGSEHSSNLVMVGHFKDAGDAAKTKEIIDAITKQVSDDQAAGTLSIGNPSERFGTAMLDLLVKLNVSTIGPGELEQFAYEANVELKGNDIVLTTEEFDVSAFLKLMVLKGARIEVYSAHDYPNTDHGRGR